MVLALAGVLGGCSGSFGGSAAGTAPSPTTGTPVTSSGPPASSATVLPVSTGLHETVSAAAGFGSLWVTGRADQEVVRIDPSTNKVTAVVKTPLMSAFVTTTADAVWVSSPAANALLRIDPDTNRVDRVLRSTALDYPVGVAGAGRWLWVASHHGTPPHLVLVDSRRGRVAGTVAMPSPAGDDADLGPHYVAVHGGDVWTGVPSLRALVHVSALARKVVGQTVVADTSCQDPASGPVAATSMAVLVGSCGVIQVEPATDEVVRQVGPAGSFGQTVLDGSAWVLSTDGLDEIDLADGDRLGRVDVSALDGQAPGDGSLTAAFGSVWVVPRLGSTVLRVTPAVG